jgi:dsDNA-specific endonuclease/ATPase MutS2
VTGGDGDDDDDDDDDDEEPELPEVVEVAIGPELDLHTFAPADVAELVADYLDECAARGFAEVRIVHGKGTGTLRRIVHGVLDRHAAVAGYALAEGRRGGWGATVVRLRRTSASSE